MSFKHPGHVCFVIAYPPCRVPRPDCTDHRCLLVEKNTERSAQYRTVTEMPAFPVPTAVGRYSKILSVRTRDWEYLSCLARARYGAKNLREAFPACGTALGSRNVVADAVPFRHFTAVTVTRRFSQRYCTKKFPPKTEFVEKSADCHKSHGGGKLQFSCCLTRSFSAKYG